MYTSLTNLVLRNVLENQNVVKLDTLFEYHNCYPWQNSDQGEK